MDFAYGYGKGQVTVKRGRFGDSPSIKIGAYHHDGHAHTVADLPPRNIPALIKLLQEAIEGEEFDV